MPRPRSHGQGALSAVSREAGDPRIGDGATALWSDAGWSPPRWRCGARFDSAPPGPRRALLLRHGRQFRAGPVESAGVSPDSNNRSAIHASASARRTVRDHPRMNVPRGTSVRNTWASSLRWAAARSRAIATQKSIILCLLAASRSWWKFVLLRQRLVVLPYKFVRCGGFA